MNKTLSVNIGGIVFHIEEHAFEKLSKYLETIKGYFTTSDGRDEIIQDIEGRIAEMFQERVSGSKQVILESDVTMLSPSWASPSSLRPNQKAALHKERRFHARNARITGGYTAMKTTVSSEAYAAASATIWV